MKKPLLVMLLIFLSSTVCAQIVRMETSLGDIDIELRPDVAPLTVANFLNYVNDGDYNNSYFHRSARNFIIQGGGFTFIDGVSGEVAVDSPVINEFNLSNTRGTIAMAKLDNNPNSATSQWFFNTVNNSANLDNQNGGFTVFGSVINGMDVVDAIAALDIWPAGGVLNSIPLINYSGSGTIENDLVLVTRAFVLDDSLNINSGLNGAWFNPSTSGQGILIEVLPTLDSVFMAWFLHDSVLPVEEEVAIVGSPGQRWLSGLGVIDHDNNTVIIDLTNTSGGLFNDNRPVVNSDANSYGTVILSFQDCSNIDVDFDLIEQELSGSFSMGRIAGDNIALCQSLSQAVAQ
ncbi:MAG: peptidylprolyl isomerase [Proteobacteria bacterium]|nr:peptidylprolyl isomerase [Pseudomonadota bacterium]